MGTERKAITFKAIAENEAWLEAEVTRLNAALAPLEVRKSGLLNALVSMARTQQIQLPLSFLQGKPSLPGTPSSNGLAENLPQVAGSEVAPKTASGGFTLSTESTRRGVECCTADKSVEYPDAALPQKAVRRRAERAS